MPNALIFASHGSDAENYSKALRRLRCKDYKRIYSADDINADSPCDFAVVEIFDHAQAKIANPHVADDQSVGVRVLKRLRDRWPNCVILAISHTSCINGSNYVEGALLADRCVAINWAATPAEPALDPVTLVKSGLDRAREAHPMVLKLRLQQSGAAADAQPVAS